MNKTEVAGYAGVGFLLLIVLLNSYTTVPAGHNKVATLFGKVQKVFILLIPYLILSVLISDNKPILGEKYKFPHRTN